ncbi:signal peptide peptidase SppA [Treponema brennaborense]|uniref:Signal peptide peptidase SppA, 36K type n=1 Tax=Treponema brennaborense (strain DSM 12168 / CIP 105900 / DD5/3) TaxID=906968 RepID=F4LPZ1_TREBD|nr:signal peptide peptidase SppA [Treponema brennaborense]AEE16083.1 signal peptide peptidase SppA, 36K type [Treponema brennaborense DSM 12168]
MDDFTHDQENGSPREQYSPETLPVPGKIQRKKKAADKKGLIILIILFAGAALVGIGQIVLGNRQHAATPFSVTVNGKQFGTKPRFSLKEYLAVVSIEGVIEEKNDTYDQQWLLDTIGALAADSKNVGILLYIDSPGGGVYQSDEVYLELVKYKETTGNPVLAYLGPLAASGGYYIACAADYLIANRNTLTGSIGVISGQSVDLSALMDKYGIKMNTFTAGRNKDMLSINRPLTEEQRSIMQSIADECYDQFTGIVAESRGLDIEQVTALADGRVYTAAQALEHGLIDEIARYGDAVDILLNDVFENPALETVWFAPESKTSLYRYLMNARAAAGRLITGADAQSAETRLLRKAAESVVPDVPFPAYYYHR